MEFERPKKKWGDRDDGRWVKDVTGLNVIVNNIMPNRADAEVYLNDTIDVTEVLKYVAKKNEQHPDYKTTVFHCFVFAIAKMIHERKKMNYFIGGRRVYERYDISMSFMARRRFVDHSEEAMMFMNMKPDDTLDKVSYKIAGEVHEAREKSASDGGFDKVIDDFAHIPRLLLMLIIRIVRWLDFWGLVPRALRYGDMNYSTCALTNLGSIGCPSVYHHLNNYGTQSMIIAIGMIHKEKVLQPDGTEELRDVVDIGATLDERIADGFYFARSLKLVKYLFNHPELMDEELANPSNFDYNAK